MPIHEIKMLLSHNFKLYFCQLIPPKKKVGDSESLEKNHIILKTWSQSPCLTRSEGEGDQGDARGQSGIGTRTSCLWRATLQLTKPIHFHCLLWCPQDSLVGTVEMSTNLCLMLQEGRKLLKVPQPTRDRSSRWATGHIRAKRHPWTTAHKEHPGSFPGMFMHLCRRRWEKGVELWACFDPFLPKLYLPDFPAWGQRERKPLTSSYFYLNKDAWDKHNPKHFVYAKSFLLLKQVYEVETPINTPIVLFSKQQG